MKYTEKSIQQAVAIFFDYRRNIIAPNVSWIFPHECDVVVLTAAGYANEIEIKISAADLKKDFEKPKHKRKRPAKLARLFYCLPVELVDLALALVPDCYGILSVSESMAVYGQNVGMPVIKQVRPARREKGARVWTERERQELMKNVCIKYWGHRIGIKTENT